MPYNYLLEERYAENIPELIKESILLIDEAHNVEGTLEDGASIELTTQDLENVEYELKTLRDGIVNANERNKEILGDVKPIDVQWVGEPIPRLKHYLYSVLERVKTTSSAGLRGEIDVR
jgi:Rad3-related DNA helicase